MNYFIKTIILAGVALLSVSTFAAERVDSNGVSEADRAIALLEKAVSRYKLKQDSAFAEFSRQSEFVTDDLYVYVLDTNGNMLASGGSSAALVGRNVSRSKDVTGKLFFKELLDQANLNDSGSVEYHWLNKADSKVERKVARFQKLGNRIIVVGYYVPRASKEQAEVLLQRAADALKSNKEAAIAAFNDPDGKYREDDLYVFVVNLRDLHFLAHGVMPRFIGTDGSNLIDQRGKKIIMEMASILKSKNSGELDYSWKNPVTNKVEQKHTYFLKSGDLLVAVGYYFR